MNGTTPATETPSIDHSTSRVMLLLLVAMTGIAPISLYMLVPALPVLARTFGSDIAIAQMTVSLYMVGLAFSQLIMGPLSDRFGRRPVLLTGLCLMVIAGIGGVFADTMPQLIAARFFQALGGATGMVMSRAIIRDLYPRERVGAMISLVIAVMMIAQMLSPLAGGLLEIGFGWRSIFYVVTAASLIITIAIAVMLPETRRFSERIAGAGFISDLKVLANSRAFLGYLMCYVVASWIIFTFAGGGPYVVINQMGRTGAEYGAWFVTSGFAYLMGNVFCVRLAPRRSIEQLIWFGLTLQFAGSMLNLLWGVTGFNHMPAWLFLTHMIVMFGNAFVMSNAAAGALSMRPQAAGSASGLMGFLQMGLGSLCSQFGAYLGGHFHTAIPLNIAMVVLSLGCACAMIFLVPRGGPVATEEMIEEAEGEESGLL